MSGVLDATTISSYPTLESIPPGLYRISYNIEISYLPSGFGAYGILEIRGEGNSCRVAWLRDAYSNKLYTNQLYLGQTTYRGWKQIAATAPQ